MYILEEAVPHLCSKCLCAHTGAFNNGVELFKKITTAKTHTFHFLVP